MPRPVLLLLACALAACTARQTAADEAEATCRAQAITDTSELPGYIAGTDRDRLVRRCLAARAP